MKLCVKFTNQRTEELYKNREKKFDWKNGDSGIDLSYVDEMGRKCILAPGGTALIKTGVCCQLSEADSDNWEIQVRGRSGLNSKGVCVHLGTVDYGYTGEIGVAITNHSREDFVMLPGDRIAQIVVCPIAKPEIEFVNELKTTDRGNKGFGSSGK